MPTRNARKLTIRPKGLSDSQDGSNTFPGAMSLLKDLVPSPTTEGLFVARPASQEVTAFLGFELPGAVSALLVLSGRAYGLVASSRFPGHDEPFCYDLVNQVFVPIQGVTEANTPQTQPSVGDWVPPTIVAITNARILVTHPGFPGGAGAYFGWFDVSGFVAGAIEGNTTAGSPVVQSIQNPTYTSAPILSGVQPGQAVSGPGIPAGATVVSATNGTFNLETTGDTTLGSSTIINVPSTAGVQYGMIVTSPNIPVDAYVTGITDTTITVSAPATLTATDSAVDVAGGGSITLSEPATATANGVALGITGGTAAAPLWGAGNTNTNPLFEPPTCVAQFNSRAYFGVANYVVFSDAANPTQVTNANQALTLGDSTPVVALEGLPYTNTVTGGVVAALIAFKPPGSPLYQITGDAGAAGGSTLAQNEINGSVGTDAPATICANPAGISYIAADGLRLLTLTGQTSDPVGANGEGVSVPFLSALYPSRMCGAFNLNTYRMSVQNGAKSGQPFEEYWYNFKLKAWSGPHSFPASVIEPYGAEFLLASANGGQGLWASAVTPGLTSTFIENGSPMSFVYETVVLPDNEAGEMNSVIEGTLAANLVGTSTVTLTVLDEYETTISSCAVPYRAPGYVAPMQAGIWGSMIWGQANWQSAQASVAQHALRFPEPVVFKQAQVQVTGASRPDTVLGNLRFSYEVLGYMLEVG